MAPELVQDIFPSSAYLDEALEVLSPDAIDVSIAVLDPLISPGAKMASHEKIGTVQSTDRRGFSAYARCVATLLHALGDNRKLARKNIWALRHFFVLSIYAQDIINVPSAISRSPVFDDKVSTGALADIVARSRQISVYLLNASAVQDDDKWRRPVLNQLLDDSGMRKSHEEFTQLQGLLLNTVVHAQNGDGLRDTRVLKLVLESIFQDRIDIDEAELWLQVARRIEKTGLCLFLFLLLFRPSFDKGISTSNLHDHNLGHHSERRRTSQTGQISE